MRLTFLGTGTSQGVPVIACSCEVCQSEDERDKRLRSSVLIEIGKHKLIIDAGPDFRQQALRTGIKQLDAILITHEHTDHIFGLDDIRAFNWLQKHPMDIYAEERVQNAIKRVFSYVFANYKYPGIPRMNLHEIQNHPFNIYEIEITPIRGSHYKLPVFGFRIGKLAYLTDMNHLEAREKEKLKDLDTLIISSLRKEEHISHFTLPQALELITELQPKKAYLTHLSHQMGLYKDVVSELPDNVFLAYDGLQLEISCKPKHKNSHDNTNTQ